MQWNNVFDGVTDDITLTYPFFHRPIFDILEDGWQAFSSEAEFNRIQNHVGSEWRLSHVNKNFEVDLATSTRTLM